MFRNDILEALDALGAACADEAEIVVVGGAAGVLCRWIDRATTDVDVVDADPRLSVLGGPIARVAEEMGLPEKWLNDGARAFAHVLPADFRERVSEVGTFGRLAVRVIGRRDFILMKLYAMRAEDLVDLRALDPTDEELAFVRDQLPRLAEVEAKKAHLIELYVQQGGGW